jgi:hypothetical protein
VEGGGGVGGGRGGLGEKVNKTSRPACYLTCGCGGCETKSRNRAAFIFIQAAAAAAEEEEGGGGGRRRQRRKLMALCLTLSL